MVGLKLEQQHKKVKFGGSQNNLGEGGGVMAGWPAD
jgi:hypothetical protein